MANPNTAPRYARKLVPVAAKTFQLDDGAAMRTYEAEQKAAGYRVKTTKRYNGKRFGTGVKLYVNVVYTYEKAK